MVISLAERLGIKDLDVEFEMRPLTNKDELVSPLPDKMTYWLALTSYLAIQRVPQPQLLKVLQQYTSEPEEVSSWDDFTEILLPKMMFKKPHIWGNSRFSHIRCNKFSE